MRTNRHVTRKWEYNPLMHAALMVKRNQTINQFEKLNCQTDLSIKFFFFKSLVAKLPSAHLVIRWKWLQWKCLWQRCLWEKCLQQKYWTFCVIHFFTWQRQAIIFCISIYELQILQIGWEGGRWGILNTKDKLERDPQIHPQPFEVLLKMVKKILDIYMPFLVGIYTNYTHTYVLHINN